MPRNKRLDCPGTIHHVIVRGMERRKIFHSDEDCREFLKRLERYLEETQCRCYAWALMPNHFHLLIRTGETSLSGLMRRLLTSYAVYFNKCHRRSGYLYQNRYKSILCQEDAYFLELVRYIHLNPIRAKIVSDLRGLDQYEWTGHSVLMGKMKKDWQETKEVLVQFSSRRKEAVLGYKKFMRDGLQMGKRKDLTGGGLQRSAGGWEAVKQLKRNKEPWRGDERILGDGDFVNNILVQAEEKFERKMALRQAGWDLDKLVKKACAMTSVRASDLKMKSRQSGVSLAKQLIAYWGTQELGLSGQELAKYLDVSRQAVSKKVAQGRHYVEKQGIKLLS
jgi:putative transposase